MLNSLTELQNLLTKIGISERKIMALPIPECEEVAFAIEIKEGEDDFKLWEKFHSALPETGRYPVLHFNEEDIFYDWKNSAELIQRVEDYDYNKMCEYHNQRYTDYMFDNDILDYVETAVDETQLRFLTSPTIEEVTALITSGKIKSYFELEYWFLQWEINFSHADDVLEPEYSSHITWHNFNREQIVLLLPFYESWKTLAFIYFFGSDELDDGIPAAIGMLKHWEEKYGAKIVAHHCTMLRLQVESLPADIEEAFLLACQQEAFAPCTTGSPCVSLRDHARTLLKSRRWFLHERP
jgi:hypothetical protein